MLTHNTTKISKTYSPLLGKETLSNGSTRASTGRTRHALQRARPGDRAVLAHAAGRGPRRGERRGLLHLPRGVQVPAHQGMCVKPYVLVRRVQY